VTEQDPFEAALDAGRRLRDAEKRLSARLADKPWDPWKTLEEWQREERPEWDELQSAIEANHQAAKRLAAEFDRRFPGEK
jgi:hypothetical protein